MNKKILLDSKHLNTAWVKKKVGTLNQIQYYLRGTFQKKRRLVKENHVKKDVVPEEDAANF